MVKKNCPQVLSVPRGGLHREKGATQYDFKF